MYQMCCMSKDYLCGALNHFPFDPAACTCYFNGAFLLQGKKPCCPPTSKPSMTCSPLSGQSETVHATMAAAPGTSSVCPSARWTQQAVWYVLFQPHFWKRWYVVSCLAGNWGFGHWFQCGLSCMIEFGSPGWESCKCSAECLKRPPGKTGRSLYSEGKFA